MAPTASLFPPATAAGSAAVPEALLGAPSSSSRKRKRDEACAPTPSAAAAEVLPDFQLPPSDTGTSHGDDAPPRKKTKVSPDRLIDSSTTELVRSLPPSGCGAGSAGSAPTALVSVMWAGLTSRGASRVTVGDIEAVTAVTADATTAGLLSASAPSHLRKSSVTADDLDDESGTNSGRLLSRWWHSIPTTRPRPGHVRSGSGGGVGSVAVPVPIGPLAAALRALLTTSSTGSAAGHVRAPSSPSSPPQSRRVQRKSMNPTRSLSPQRTSLLSVSGRGHCSSSFLSVGGRGILSFINFSTSTSPLPSFCIDIYSTCLAKGKRLTGCTTVVL